VRGTDDLRAGSGPKPFGGGRGGGIEGLGRIRRGAVEVAREAVGIRQVTLGHGHERRTGGPPEVERLARLADPAPQLSVVQQARGAVATLVGVHGNRLDAEENLALRRQSSRRLRFERADLGHALRRGAGRAAGGEEQQHQPADDSTAAARCRGLADRVSAHSVSRPAAAHCGLTAAPIRKAMKGRAAATHYSIT